jgi:predicted transcriptional regulator
MTELTKAEEQVMQILWKLERGMARDVLDQFPNPKPAYNTVSTIIRILEKKEVVSHKAYGKNFEYFPLISKKDYAKTRFNHVFENYFSGSFPKLATFFAKDNKLSLDEFDELMSMIREEVKKESGEE